MRVSLNLIKKLVWYTRAGQNYYLMWVVTLANFILISYSFLFSEYMFEENEYILLIFSLVFIVNYFVISILIGRWHNKTQTRIDTTIRVMHSPVLAKMFKMLLDVQTGKATKKEIEEFRDFISKIENLNIEEI